MTKLDSDLEAQPLESILPAAGTSTLSLSSLSPLTDQTKDYAGGSARREINTGESEAEDASLRSLSMSANQKIDPEAKSGTILAKLAPEVSAIFGVGCLSGEIKVVQMMCKYGVACTIFCPQIAFRETVTRHTVFAYTHEQRSSRDACMRHGTDRINVDDRRQVREEHVAMVHLS